MAFAYIECTFQAHCGELDESRLSAPFITLNKPLTTLLRWSGDLSSLMSFSYAPSTKSQPTLAREVAAQPLSEHDNMMSTASFLFTGIPYPA
tara:strand:- start:840 stop:1115 length:276 start_codon:yes stop_codon:yes gene_type:complete